MWSAWRFAHFSRHIAGAESHRVLKHDHCYLLTGGEGIVEIDGEGSVVWHVAIYAKAGPGERGRNRGARSRPGILGSHKTVFVETATQLPSGGRF